jgi:hypothetical protein
MKVNGGETARTILDEVPSLPNRPFLDSHHLTETMQKTSRESTLMNANVREGSDTSMTETAATIGSWPQRLFAGIRVD